MIEITLTFAQSIDGRIATASGESRYISRSASLRLNQEMRHDHDAILVGIGTVLRDDPLLTCRIEEESSPIRIIVDSRLRLPSTSRIAVTAARYPTLLVCSEKALLGEDPEIGTKKDELIQCGIEILPVPETREGKIDLQQTVAKLERRRVRSIMVEGGSSILTSFLTDQLWNRMVIVTAPIFLGTGIPAFGDLGIDKLDEAVLPTVNRIDILENEVVWYLVPGEPPKRTEMKEETESVFFTAPLEVEVRSHGISPRHPQERLFRSRLMAISPGTERIFFSGRFERGGEADPEIDCTEGSFKYPFTYGYINILENEKGHRFFGLKEHTRALFALEHELLPIPEDMSDERALLIAHAETALGIVHDSSVSAGDSVLVVGGGVLGALSAYFLRYLMGCRVTVMDLCLEKQSWFDQGRFPHLPALHDLEFTGAEDGLGEYDACLDTSGSERGLQTAIEHACFEGKVIAASWFGAPAVKLRLGEDFHKKRLLLKSSQVSRINPVKGDLWSKQRRFSEVIEILQYLQPDFLITHRFLFSQAQKAFTIITEGNSVHGLIALIP